MAGGRVPTHTPSGVPIEVRRSSRRKRTVSASFRNGAAVVLIPGHFTRKQESEWVQRMIGRLETRPDKSSDSDRTEHPDRSEQDSELRRRALKLAGHYLPKVPEPVSVRWVSNQSTRWGSATPSRRTIRLSDQLKGMPGWVIDYVLLHELAHLAIPSHGRDFWDLLSVYPALEKARAFLDGAAFAAGRGLNGQDLPESSVSEEPSPESS